MKAYRRYRRIIINDVELSTYYCGITLKEEITNEDYSFTWDTINDFPFGWITERRKGRVLSYMDENYKNHKYKEWETPLNIKIMYRYKEYTPSIQDILNYHDGEKAIQYLVERGLSVVK